MRFCMKQIVLVLTLALLAIPVWAKPQQSSSLTISGGVVAKAFSINNYKGSEVRDEFMVNRVLLSIENRFTPNISGSVLLGETRQWGRSAWNYQVNEPGPSETLNDALEQIGIYNAWVRISDAFPGVTMTIGRQFQGSEGDPLLYYGPRSDRFLAVTSLDAVKVEAEWGPVEMMGLGGHKNESGLGDGSGVNPDDPYSPDFVDDEDTDIFALEVASSHMVQDQRLSAFVHTRKTGLPDNKQDDLYVLGAQTKGAISQIPGLAYELLFAMNSGTNEGDDRSYGGRLYKLGGSYSLSSYAMGDFKLLGGYLNASGDDPATEDKNEGFTRVSRDGFNNTSVIVYQFFNDTHPEAVSNAVVPYAGAELRPAALGEKVGISVMWTDVSCETPVMDCDKVGTEIDYRIGYIPSNYFSVGVTWATFDPGDLYETLYGSTNPTRQLSIEFDVEF